MLRKFRRDQLRKLVGNRNMSDSWENVQRKKYRHRYKEICKKKIYKLEGLR